MYSAEQERKEQETIQVAENKLRERETQQREQGKLEMHEYEIIGLKRRDELVSEGITPVGVNILILGRLNEQEFDLYKTEQKKQMEYTNIGSQRRKELESQGFTNIKDDDKYLGQLNDHDYNLFKIELERKRKEKEQKLKDQQVEISIILTKVKNCRSEELVDLNDEQKNYLLRKWEEEISQLYANGNRFNEIINYLCGKENAKIKTRLVTEDKSKNEHGNKFQKIIETIKNYYDTRIIRDERELESVINVLLKTKFPEYNVVYQKKIPKGRVDIVIDDEIAIELKIADNTGNLNQLFGQIEWYKEVYKQLIIVILDLDRVPEIDDFVRKFKERGASVIVLTEENIRFKRSNQ